MCVQGRYIELLVSIVRLARLYRFR